ncbi:MAG TPA: orotate phosphoribosyltransferase [Candidatus Hydrogenedentes bacterium]|nr:orotate phosphoribosyltransferase [Candidatus Hydrogenedentota bacterium]HQE82820.1 orotate phosphoribosyltransferase [Candidatus Hydrogenedentota bacterium]HQH53970.1 orotate phosphoribosyltransferase [Candidatus Hydrogenedentota bacterium]
MNGEQVLAAFREAGALLDGHFLYASGRHGRQFLQAARVLQFPDIAERLCAAMASRFKDARIDLVVGPATGGIILAYETARHLGCRAAFTEKEQDGAMALKRGFLLRQGERVLVVEDIATTGGSIKKSIAHLRQRGAQIAGVSVLIDRSSGEASFDCPYEPLARLDMQSWDPAACELCRAGKPLLDPDDIVLKS